MLCPMVKDDCMELACGWWCEEFEECAMALMGRCAGEMSCAVDDTNFECRLRVQVTKTEVR